MIKINLLKDRRNEAWEEANRRFHSRFQLACLVVIVLIFVFTFTYGQ